MDLKYFDAHCHVQFDAFAEDRAELLARMKERGVGGVVVGCDASSSRAAADLADAHDNLWSSAGLHPNHVQDEKYDDHELRNLLSYPKAVAVGECGLDYFRPSEVNEEIKAAQKEVLEKHLFLAASANRPLIIHARPSKGTMDAYRDLIEMLKSAKREHGERLTGDIHFFVGGVEEARELIALDFTISYTAVITFARDYDEPIRFAPLSHILSETDSPYVAPLSRRGKRNDPLSVEEVVAKLAEIRGEDLETMRQATVSNALRLFKITDA
jgi:TatD DNase family protein